MLHKNVILIIIFEVKCYKKLIKYYPENTALLSLLPLSMRITGPEKAVWHTIIRKTWFTHFVGVEITPDHRIKDD